MNTQTVADDGDGPDPQNPLVGVRPHYPHLRVRQFPGLPGASAFGLEALSAQLGRKFQEEATRPETST